jgi:polygalacturonase
VSGPFFDVTAFGAVGDGVTDNYAALRAAAAAINAAGGGTLYFPPGAYYVARYRGDGLTPQASNISYVNCTNLTIEGYGAKVMVNGNFDRASGGNIVIPFNLYNCSNFTLEGLEIAGDVDQERNSTDLVEAYAYGIATSQCSNYTIRDVYVHGFQTDGIYLGGSNSIADRNATLINVVSSGNARQGLSIIQLYGGQFIGCTFEDTGLTNATATNVGGYGWHNPGTGVDVEPNRWGSTIDVNTGNLDFENCTFSNNLGGQFRCGSGVAVDGLTLNSCTFVRGVSPNPHEITIACLHGLVRHCTVKGGDIYTPSWNGVTASNTVLKSNSIDPTWDPSQAILVPGNP